jgi:hypothetical protein
MHIQSMTLESSMLQILKHEYSSYFTFVIFVDFVTFVGGILPLYTINVGAVNLFANSYFSIFTDFQIVLFNILILSLLKKINHLKNHSKKLNN